MNDAIRHIDQRLKLVRRLSAIERPPKGWIRAVRDALGMTSSQLARRLGVAQPRIPELEKAEVSGAVTLHSLERAAEALGCRVVYALVPERPLVDILKKQAERAADQQLALVEQTMGLEAQAVRDPKARKKLRAQLIDKLLQSPTHLWDEI